ncbi:MAG TPA: DUF1800 domain-containing protein [Candidatus Didemnitutus sp.]|nr:DUF1800 domain-containing protein [Candidatus Didemnitutus sp.]
MIDLSPRTTPLTLEDAAHLLRRATYHPTWTSAAMIVGRTPSEVVNTLIDTVEPPPNPPSWAGTPPEFNDFAAAALLWPELQQWWMSRAITLPSLRERLVMLWQNTFSTDYITVYAGQWMLRQSQTIREKAFAFKDLATSMVSDPAMLRYLSGDQSIKGNPNENFAREWFELFTLGVGNYTERDVVEAARAFTGWRISGIEGVYNRGLADLGEKTILGQTGPWEWGDVVRITFEQDACARWVARKLLMTFVEFAPSADDIQGVATLVKQNSYDLKPVLKTLLTSQHFFDPVRRGALIKSPADLVIGLAAVLRATDVDLSYAISSMTKLTQEPYYPPTVEGWKGHHAWITSSTFPQRQRYAESFIDGRQTGSSSKLLNTSGKPLTPDVVAFIRLLPDHNDAMKVVENVAKILLPVPTTQEQRDVLLEIMLAGAQVYEWDIDAPSAVQRVKFLLQAIVRMPEFQLM